MSIKEILEELPKLTSEERGQLRNVLNREVKRAEVKAKRKQKAAERVKTWKARHQYSVKLQRQRWYQRRKAKLKTLSQ